MTSIVAAGIEFDIEAQLAVDLGIEQSAGIERVVEVVVVVVVVAAAAVVAAVVHIVAGLVAEADVVGRVVDDIGAVRMGEVQAGNKIVAVVVAGDVGEDG
jgi:hypothetical protein